MGTYTKQQAIDLAVDFAREEAGNKNLKVKKYLMTFTPTPDEVEPQLRDNLPQKLEKSEYSGKELATIANQMMAENNVRQANGQPVIVTEEQIAALARKRGITTEVAQAPAAAQQTAPATTPEKPAELRISQFAPPASAIAAPAVPGTPELEPNKKAVGAPEEPGIGQQAGGLASFLKVLVELVASYTGSLQTMYASSRDKVDATRANQPDVTGGGIGEFLTKVYTVIGAAITNQEPQFADAGAKHEPEARPRDYEIKSTALDKQLNPEMREYQAKLTEHTASHDEPLKPTPGPTNVAARGVSVGRGFSHT